MSKAFQRVKVRNNIPLTLKSKTTKPFKKLYKNKIIIEPTHRLNFHGINQYLHQFTNIFSLTRWLFDSMTARSIRSPLIAYQSIEVFSVLYSFPFHAMKQMLLHTHAHIEEIMQLDSNTYYYYHATTENVFVRVRVFGRTGPPRRTDCWAPNSKSE